MRGLPGRSGTFNQTIEKTNGKIVDDFPAEIFQQLESRGLSGTQQASYQQDTLAGCNLSAIVRFARHGLPVLRPAGFKGKRQNMLVLSWCIGRGALADNCSRKTTP
jgi:hypothetical protein